MTATVFASGSRVPGVTIVAPAPPPDDLLPRMDVAGFVGFARTGPVDVPVAIDAAAQFRQVFGDPLPLVRDVATGVDGYAYLARAVASFFANGGRRCWVVRVTGREAVAPYRSLAVRARFEVGLRAADASGALVPLPVPVRAAGSWADDLVAGAGLLTRAVQVDDVRVEASRVRLRLVTGELAVHDLVRISRGDGRLMFAVSAVDGDRITGVDAVWTTAPVPADSGPFAAEVCTLQLTASTGAGPRRVLSDLGFVPGHPRYVGDLPTDEQTAQTLLDGGHPPAAPWSFPLAGPVRPGGPPPVVYPADTLIADARPQPADPLDPPDPPGQTRLDRDGLSRFRPGDALDPRLVTVGWRALPSTVEQIRDVQEQPLLGLHALLGLDEVTVIALPDLVHRPWTSVPGGPPALPLPAHETFRVTRDCAHDGPADLHDLPGPPPPQPSGIGARAGSDGTVTIAWAAIAGATFVLEEAAQPWTWAGSREVFRGAGTGCELYGRSPGRYLYRLRAETAPAAGDWSDPVVVDRPGLDPFATADADLGTLAAAQAAAVTACAARGDVLAVLAAPAGGGPAEAAALAAAVRARAAGDERLLSYGAVYHPWIRTADGTSEPPDGAVSGMLCAVAAERGCWREPANLPLAGVTGLDPDPGPVRATAANLLRRQPHGTAALSAVTLSADDDLGRIAVRRLLALIRRTALRYGPADVFEPLGDRLRRQVRRRFEELLALLLARGAFAGPGPAQSYQVTVGAPAPDRLQVDVRIAPAAALRFLTVRLVSSGAGLTVSDEG